VMLGHYWRQLTPGSMPDRRWRRKEWAKSRRAV
jgi:hypothetical protein